MSEEERITIEMYPEGSHIYWRNEEICGLNDLELIRQIIRIREEVTDNNLIKEKKT